MTPTLEETEAPNEGIDAPQAHPEGSDTQTGQDFTELYGERFEQLPTQLVQAIRGLVSEFQHQDEYPRRREVMRDRRNRYYEKGVQHLYENTQGLVPMQAGQISNGINGRGQAPNYIDDYNITRPYSRVIDSVLTQNPPGIAFRPINAQLQEDKEAADQAERYTEIFDRSNDLKGLQMEQIRFMRVSGRVVSWTRTEADAQMFGQNTDGTAKRMEITSFYGTLESKVPILAKSQKDALYTFLFDDPDVKQARAQYPGSGAEGKPFAKSINPGVSGVGESEYERTARLGILQGTRTQVQQGDAMSHVVTRMNCWLRPGCFVGGADNDKLDQPFEEAEESDINEDGSQFTVKDKLLQLFPSGCHAVFVGETYVASWDESLDDALDIAFPYKGDGMSREGIMDLFVVIQDLFNDVTNALRQASDTGWPHTWVDGEDQDIDAITNQRADPYAIQVRKARKDLAMADSFFREPDLVLPETVMQWLNQIAGPLAQLMLATPPVLFGQGDDHSETASGTSQLKAQAMGQLGLIWGMMQRQWARIRYQAALLATRNPDHEQGIAVASGDDTSPVQIQKISKGHFGAYPDEDSSFPESTAQKRQNMTVMLQMAAQSPEIGQQLMTSPDNWRTFADLEGFSELVIPQAESRDKQLLEIEELLKGQPLPPDPAVLQAAQQQHAAQMVQAATAATAAGQPVPPPQPFDPTALLTPSVPVEELDYHPWEFEKCKEWLSSDACRRQLALRTDDYPAGNKMGVLNVKLHALQHQKFMMAEAAQQAAMGIAPALAAPPKTKKQQKEGNRPRQLPPAMQPHEGSGAAPSAPPAPAMAA